MAKVLGRHSLVPVISKFIDCEIKPAISNRSKIQKAGIEIGTGIRQGMPLSPILANLVLSEFDNRIERHELKMVRYADDIAVFFRTKHEAQEGHRFISDALAQIKLTVPGLGDDSKTQLLGPSDPIGFLGLEIVRVGSDNRAVRRVPKKQIQKIVKRLEDEYTLKARLNTDSNFQETVVELWNSIAAYLSSYKGTYNYLSLDSSLRAASSSDYPRYLPRTFW